MSQLDHPNLVKLFGMTMNPLGMVMEFVPSGSLYHLLYENIKNLEISVKLQYKIMMDIAKGMHFLQTVAFPPILHRDLRSPNVFVCIVFIDKKSPRK